MPRRPAVMTERMIRMQQRLADLGLDGLLLFDMKNIRYLTGFTGSEGACLVRASDSVLLVDGRYLTQAREQVRGVEIYLSRDKLTGLAAVLSDRDLKTIGFESAALTFDLHAHLKKRLGGRALKPVGDPVQLLRSVKDGTELTRITQAIDLSHQALGHVTPLIRAGARERDIAIELEYRMKVLGAEEPSFPTIVASGPRTALPHAEPGLRKIRGGDAVMIDYGAVVAGYHSDETCTLIVDDVDAEVKRVYAIVKEAHDRAIEAVKAGMACREIDHIARDVIDAQGFGEHFPHGTGHGVGLDVHELPRLGPTAEGILEAGMVVTIEPGVYLPGRWGIRIEDMVLVEEKGCRVLTKTTKELKILHSS